MQKTEIHGDRNMSTRFSSSRRGLVRGLLFTFLATSALVPAGAAAKPGAAQAASLRDGVVVDAARSIAYVMHPKGGIQAIDLQRGTSLWRSTEGERPLALSGNLLVAQAKPGQSGELRVVALDVRQQGAVSAKAHLPMPAGIRADVSEGLQQEFQVTASPTRQGIVVAWEAQELPGLPGRENEERDRRPGVETKAAGRAERAEADSAQGAALFDLRAGRLSPVAEAKAAIQRNVVVSLPSAGPDRLFASADGRHVLASRPVEGDTDYLWKISDAATGAVLGTFRSDVSMSPFTVAGTRLIYVAQPGLRLEGSKMVEEPLRLRALDVATGRELWSRDIRDTAFRGPFPQ